MRLFSSDYNFTFVAKTPPFVVSVLSLVVAMFLARPPQEATSNLSKWAEFLGLKNISHWVQNPFFDRWAIASLIVLAILVWVIPYILNRRRKAFEIIYDHRNIGRQFRELKTVEEFSSHTTGVEYRVKIRNNTDRTLEDVKVKSEFLGQIGTLPIRLKFHETKQPTCTLDPHDSAFVPLLFIPLPLFKPGTPTGISFSSFYGPVRVTVSAKNTKAVVRDFHLTPISIPFDPFKQSLIS